MDDNYSQTLAIYRPMSLAEIAAWTLQDGEFDMHIKDFLHEFDRKKKFFMLKDKPVLLRDAFDDGGVRDAYLAATAAYLARTINREVPQWTMDISRQARRPWFAAPAIDALHTMLLCESPPEFRERNLFISANALTVR